MDKTEKALRKLTLKERSLISAILRALKSGKLVGLDVKRLKGMNNIFRVRKGNFRIIYRLDGGDIFILAIERRDEKTYKF